VADGQRIPTLLPTGTVGSGKTEDLVVVNGGRPIQDVAADILREVGWP
jgi:hypothetical protein